MVKSFLEQAQLFKHHWLQTSITNIFSLLVTEFLNLSQKEVSKI